MAGIMVEIGLIKAILYRRTKQTRGDRCGMEGPTVTGAVLEAPPLSLVVRRVVGIGSYHHFHRCCSGCGVFVSVQQYINNKLHTNPNCKILKYSAHSVYNIIILLNNTNHTNFH